jgi:hypothetical protein
MRFQLLGTSRSGSIFASIKRNIIRWQFDVAVLDKSASFFLISQGHMTSLNFDETPTEVWMQPSLAAPLRRSRDLHDHRLGRNLLGLTYLEPDTSVDSKSLVTPTIAGTVVPAGATFILVVTALPRKTSK